MKVRKNISKLLVLGFILNNTSALFNISNASNDIPNRYETLEGEQITIDDSIAGEFEEIEIFGNTVQDSGSKNLFSSPLERGYISYDGTLVSSGYSVRSSEYISVEPSTTYSIKVLDYNNNLYIHQYDIFGNISGEKTVTPYNHKFTTDDNIYFIKVNSYSSDECSLDTTAKFQLNKGDDFLDYDDYREPDLNDIQSVGDLYVDEKGDPILDKQGREQYKIDVITMGSNLINPDMLEYGLFDYITGEDINDTSTHIRYNGYIRVKELQKYYTYNDLSVVTFFDKDMKPIGYSLDTNGTSFSTPKDCMYIRIRTHNYDYDLEDFKSKAFLSETNKYSDYIENKTQILLPTQLQKIRGLADKLYWDNTKGKYIIEKNIKTILLDGSQDWYDTGVNINDTVYLQLVNKLDIIGSWQKPWLISNRFKPRTNGELYYHGIEGICTASDDGKYIEIRIKKSKLSTENASGFKSYLASNPVTVYYVTSNPYVIDTNITSKLQVPIYDDRTYLSTETENGINPTLKVVIDRLPNISKDAVEDAKYDTTTEKLSLARMYVNMLPESLYKDSLQAELNSIFSTDVTFDKNTVSSNVDVYVKSDNMLSMSLDTNSVTFEGYSGVAPMELKDAVNITINSSLPYDLNAYMPTEISNSDGSNTIDFDIFNIKESTETAYNQFADTTNKVVLKSGCVEGNSKSHKIDLKLDSNNAHVADIYKTVIRFEAVQK